MTVNTYTDFSYPLCIKNILKPNSREYTIYIFMKFLQILLLTILPYILGNCINQLEQGNIKSSSELVLFFSLSFIEFFVTIVVYGWNIRLSNKIALQIEYDTMRHIKHVPYLKIKDYDNAYLAQRINNDAVVIGDYLIEQVPYFISNLLFIGFVTGIIFMIHPALGILISAFIILFILLYLLTKRLIYRKGLEMFEAQGNFFAMLSNHFLNILSIKVNTWYDETDQEFEKIVTVFFQKSISYLQLIAAVSSANLLICRIICGSVICLLGWISWGREIPTSSLIVFIMYIQLLLSNLQSATEFGQKTEQYKVAKNRIDSFTTMKTEVNGDIKLDTIENISVENLSVIYNKDFVLNNINIFMQRGYIYVIRGQNGSGKTTLINALLGVIHPIEGAVLYDGHEISSLDLYSVRKELFAVTTQEPYLKNGTLLENVTYGTQKVLDLNVATPILSELLSFFQNKDNKENTYITSKNTSLSGGEKQKLSICRALLKNAIILIFDEPTNDLDAESIEKFYSYLCEIKSEHIIILISHHEKAIEIADQIIDL